MRPYDLDFADRATGTGADGGPADLTGQGCSAARLTGWLAGGGGRTLCSGMTVMPICQFKLTADQPVARDFFLDCLDGMCGRPPLLPQARSRLWIPETHPARHDAPTHPRTQARDCFEFRAAARCAG